MPPFTLRLSPLPHHFSLCSSSLSLPGYVSVSFLLGLYVRRGRLTDPPSLPAPLLLPLPSGPPTQADLAPCCPDGSEPGRAQGPGGSCGLARAARPSLDSRVGCLHHRVHPPQQRPVQQQGPALFPLGE